MTRVVAMGTFDLLHPGHEHYLTEARAMGDELFVIVARDDTVHHVKGHHALASAEERRAAVAALPQVTGAVIGRQGDKLAILEELQPDVVALGYDQQAFTEDLERKLAARGVHARVVRISAFHPETYKSSKLRGKG